MNFFVYICILLICRKCHSILVPGPPENLTVTRIGDKSVDLTWNRPHNPNGEVRGYRIYYMKNNFTSVRTHHRNDPLTTFTLNRLDPNSEFKIWTKAFTFKNEGNSSDSVFVKTDVSGPNAPIIANLTCQSGNTLYLHWLRPAVVYGSVHLYYIYYRPEDSFNFQEIAIDSVNNRAEHNFLLSNLTENLMYEVKVRGGTYSRFYDQNNLTYKGPFSKSQRILLTPDCHKSTVSGFHNVTFELNPEIVAGMFLAGFILILLILGIVIYRRFFHGSYYSLDDPPKMTQVLMHDWENDSGGDGAFGSIPVEDFYKHVASLHADGDIGFSKEYESIQATCAQEHFSCEQSLLPENKAKNRYLNIVAYDHSRVPMRILPGQKKSSEYINANFIDGYEKPRAYIGTQGPLPSTFDTYWRMIWEQRVYIIVMITNLVERGRRKCDQYWPKDSQETYGYIQVRLLQETVLATYTIRKFSIKHLKTKCKKASGGEREIYQYHYTSWPDHGTPDHPLPVLSFVRKSAAANPPDGGPIIVHCSAGVGRTGTYIVIDTIMQQIRQKRKLNIWGFLKHIRTQRNFLVQTEEQYIFIHDALLEAIQSGDTCIPVDDVSKYIKMLHSTGPTIEKQAYFLLHHQFRLITYINPQDFLVASALKPENSSKNRGRTFLPMECGRMHLTPKPGIDGSDYINATWLLGFNSLKEFIITQHPLQSTLLDFWQMVWDSDAQTIVVLSTIDEENGFPQFWPTHGDDYDTENWKVRYLEEKLHSGLTTIEVMVQSTQDDHELPVRLVVVPWPDTTPALVSTLNLVSVVSEGASGPHIVVDKYGGTEGATYCCLTTLKKQAENEKYVDPYMYCKLYNKLRPSVWQCPEDILRIYQVLEASLATENSSKGSSNSLAGFSDPIQMPVFCDPPELPEPILPPLALSPSIPSMVVTSPVHQPEDAYSPNVPENGNIRVPPEGMEDSSTFQIM